MFNGWEAYDHYRVYTQNAPMHAEKMHMSQVSWVLQDREKKKKKHLTRESEFWSTSLDPESCVQPSARKSEHRRVENIKGAFLDYYDRVLFGALRTCCRCTLLYYTVLWLDRKNIWVIKLYSGCHMPGIASVTSALCRETALTNQGLYALGRRQTALYSPGWSHYGSSPQKTIHGSYREKGFGGGEKKGRGRWGVGGVLYRVTEIANSDLNCDKKIANSSLYF